MTICEAMMCGKPVVSTNNGGFDEMYVEGINGIKCPIGDSSALAEAIYSIYSGKFVADPVRIRHSVLNKFGTEAFKQKIKRIYSEVIDTYEK